MLALGLNALVTFNPLSVCRDTSLNDAAELMQAHGIRHLPVVDDRRQLCGIVSDLDLAEFLSLAHRFSTGDSPAEMGLAAETVEACMICDPLSVESQAEPREALQIFLQNHIHSVPVIQDGAVYGMLTSTDFLRELSYGELPAARAAVSRHMSGEHAIVSPEMAVSEAWSTMISGEIEYLVVALNGCPLGIISRRDLRRVGAHRKNSTSAAMTLRPLLSALTPLISEQEKLGKAAERMCAGKHRALAVVNRSQKLKGLLTEDDLLAALLPDLD